MLEVNAATRSLDSLRRSNIGILVVQLCLAAYFFLAGLEQFVDHIRGISLSISVASPWMVSTAGMVQLLGALLLTMRRTWVIGASILAGFVIVAAIVELSGPSGSILPHSGLAVLLGAVVWARAPVPQRSTEISEKKPNAQDVRRVPWISIR